MIVASFEEPL
jgi:hypothetical protein